MRRAAAAIRQLESLAQRIANLVARIGLCVLIAFAFSTLVDGLSRGVFGHPIDAVRDLGELLVAVSVSACFPLAFLQQSNIAVSFLDGILGPRGGAVLHAIAAAVATVMVALFAWQFGIYASQLAQAQETTAMLELPKAPFWRLVDANLWLTLAVQSVVLLRLSLDAARLCASRGSADWIH